MGALSARGGCSKRVATSTSNKNKSLFYRFVCEGKVRRVAQFGPSGGTTRWTLILALKRAMILERSINYARVYNRNANAAAVLKRHEIHNFLSLSSFLFSIYPHKYFASLTANKILHSRNNGEANNELSRMNYY